MIDISENFSGIFLRILMIFLRLFFRKLKFFRDHQRAMSEDDGLLSAEYVYRCNKKISDEENLPFLASASVVAGAVVAAAAGVAVASTAGFLGNFFTGVPNLDGSKGMVEDYEDDHKDDHKDRVTRG